MRCQSVRSGRKGLTRISTRKVGGIRLHISSTRLLLQHCTAARTACRTALLSSYLMMDPFLVHNGSKTTITQMKWMSLMNEPTSSTCMYVRVKWKLLLQKGQRKKCINTTMAASVGGGGTQPGMQALFMHVSSIHKGRSKFSMNLCRYVLESLGWGPDPFIHCALYLSWRNSTNHIQLWNHTPLK